MDEETGASALSDVVSTNSSNKRKKSNYLAFFVLFVLVALASWSVLSWFAKRMDRLESEVAKRFYASDLKDKQVESMIRQIQDQLRDTQNKAAVLDRKIQESAGLQAQLEHLYRTLSEDTSEILLSEAEAALSLAAQQLSLGGNRQATIGVLHQIEARLGISNDAALNPVRKALLRDIDQLKVSSASDYFSVASQIDAALSSVERMRMLDSKFITADKLSGPLNSVIPSVPKPSAEKKSLNTIFDVYGWMIDVLSSWKESMGEVFFRLFQIRRIDKPDEVFLLPEHAYFVKQNIFLSLLNARLSLLMQNNELFKKDLLRSISWINSYYDLSDQEVISVLDRLKQICSAFDAAQIPSLSDSLREVRLARSARGKSGQ